MLILTRKPEQSIVIDGTITVTVLAVDGDRVKVGITAPAEVSILRDEVRREVGGENRRAASQPLDRRQMEASLKAIGRAPHPPAPSPTRGEGESRIEAVQASE